MDDELEDFNFQPTKWCPLVIGEDFIWFHSLTVIHRDFIQLNHKDLHLTNKQSKEIQGGHRWFMIAKLDSK